MVMEKKVFRSRISVVIMGFVLVVFMLAAAPLLYFGKVIDIIIMGIIFLFVIYSVTSIRYVIIDDILCVNTWNICFGKVKIADILSVKRSYNPLSSPAASLKRLCLHFNENSKCPHYGLVSPVREQEFLDTLKSINPDIDIQVSDKHGKWRIWDWDI
jgi:hypothetical protein